MLLDLSTGVSAVCSIEVMIDSGVIAARTDAGMLALWSASAFEGVGDYPTWEARVGGRVSEAIAAGEFVPLNVGSDGARGVRVAIAPDGLTDRERQYLVVTSESYLLVNTGRQWDRADRRREHPWHCVGRGPLRCPGVPRVLGKRARGEEPRRNPVCRGAG